MSTTASSAARQNATRDYEAALDDIAARGAAAMRDTKASIDDAVANVSEKGQEALQSARDAKNTVADAILKSVRERPYTTLAIAGFIGFVYGAMRR